MFMLACGLLGLAACQTLEKPNAADEGTLLIALHDGATKADVNPIGNDAAVHDLQLFLFSADGSLYRREAFEGSSTSRSLDRVKAGTYEIAALVNGPALTSIQKKQDLLQAAVTLGDNKVDVGFVMFGSTDSPVTVTGGATSPVRADITVRRLVGRVRLTTVQNGIPSSYGALTLSFAFLENGFGNWTCGASGDPSGYVNYAGRKKGCSTSTNPSDFIGAASDAEAPTLTFQSIGRQVANGQTLTLNNPFYTFPNKNRAADDHFSGPTDQAACARLVLKASYGEGGAQSWYYPVTIENLERNKTYDVAFIIHGPGSPDPNQKVENGNLTVVVTVDPWGDGGNYTEEF